MTDACGDAPGAVLELLNPAERNYSTSERELLALTWATKNYWCYLLGGPFKIFTDRKLLKVMSDASPFNKNCPSMTTNAHALSGAIHQEQDPEGPGSGCLVAKEPDGGRRSREQRI